MTDQVADKPTVALVNLGCRVNRVELDAMGLALMDAGVALGPERDASVVVINTCAVTGEAQAKTRKVVRHAAHLPQHPLVVATGCVASLFADELAALGDNVIVEARKDQVPDRVLQALKTDGGCACALAGKDGSPQRTTPTGRTRPGIKIQDGCDNRCTFCIVWKARGASRALPLERVLAEVRRAQERGAREVVLTGINLGNYRFDDGASRGALPELLQVLLAETDVERIRLSSIEPPDVNERLLEVMASAGERVAPFLHVCLQSGSDRTLREMGRVYDSAQYAHAVERARELLPDLALGTDLIVGFPGETEEDFYESYDFCQKMAFAKMHVFRYSRRPGTPAAARADQVPPDVAAARSAKMLALADQMRAEQAAHRVGKDELVVVQYPGRGVTGGLFDCLVDECHPLDALVRVRVHAANGRGLLDARTTLGSHHMPD